MRYTVGNLIRKSAGVGLEWFVATYGSTLGAALSMNLLYPLAHIFNIHLSFHEFNRALSVPYFPVQIFFGLMVGYLGRDRFSTRFSFWVWIVPLSVLIWHFFTFVPAAFQNPWQVRVDHFLGSGCRPFRDYGGAPCFDQLIYTAPVYTAIAYALGSCVGKKTEHRRDNENEKARTAHP